MSGVPFISQRKHIKRGDGPAFEDTDTLVLTSRGKYFVDIRVFKDDALNLQDAVDVKDISQLEWGFCGTAQSDPAEIKDGIVLKPAHTVWTHWMDSRTMDDFRDEGDMWDLPSGEVLEKGADVDAETGELKPYEELWIDLDAKITGEDDKHRSYVLRYDGGTPDARGMIIRIGHHISGVRRTVDGVSAVRWEWIEADSGMGTWKRTLFIGQADFPSQSLFSGESEVSADLATGKQVVAEDDSRWTCIEAFTW